MHRLRIVEELADAYTANRFRIVEGVLTIDGQRDRMTHSSFATKADAEQFIRRWHEEQGE